MPRILSQITNRYKKDQQHSTAKNCGAINNFYNPNTIYLAITPDVVLTSFIQY